MRILFLGDIVGISGCSKLTSNLLNEIKRKIMSLVANNLKHMRSGGGLIGVQVVGICGS